MLEVEGDGGAEVPRDALAVEAMPSLRAVPRSSVQPISTPSCTIIRRAVGRPSPSKGREPEMRGRCGSSINDIDGGRTGLPKRSSAQDAPRAMDAPLIADNRCPISDAAMRSSNSTG